MNQIFQPDLYILLAIWIEEKHSFVSGTGKPVFLSPETKPSTSIVG